MRSTIGRLAGVLAAAVGLVLVASCDTSPGAAAVVGHTTISVDRLNSLLTAALKDPAIASVAPDRATLLRAELGQLISSVVVQAAATRYGVSVTQGEVEAETATLEQQVGGPSALQQAAASRGVPASNLNSFLRDITIENKLGDTLLGRNTPPLVHAAHILVASKALADRLLAQVRRHPSTFGTLAHRYSRDTSNSSSGGDLGTQPATVYVTAFANAVETARPGSYFEVHSQFGWHVVHLISRQFVNYATASPTTKQLYSSIRDRLVVTALTNEANQLRIHVNPRYGSWDSAKQTIDPPANTLSSPSPSAAPSSGVPGSSSGG